MFGWSSVNTHKSTRSTQKRAGMRDISRFKRRRSVWELRVSVYREAHEDAESIYMHNPNPELG